MCSTIGAIDTARGDGGVSAAILNVAAEAGYFSKQVVRKSHRHFGRGQINFHDWKE